MRSTSVNLPLNPFPPLVPGTSFSPVSLFSSLYLCSWHCSLLCVYLVYYSMFPGSLAVPYSPFPVSLQSYCTLVLGINSVLYLLPCFAVNTLGLLHAISYCLL
jgi:hypothetical protein